MFDLNRFFIRPRTFRRFFIFVGLIFPLVLGVALRGDTRDTAAYVDIFNSTKTFPINPLDYYQAFGVEWMFGLSAWFFNTLHLDVVLFFVFVSFLTFYFIDKSANILGLSFLEVLPYYLGSFFLTQQLMQIRQGLGIAFAFFVIVKMTVRDKNVFFCAGNSVLAALIHSATVIPIIVAGVLKAFLPRNSSRWVVVTWCFLLVAMTVVAARFVMSYFDFSFVARLSDYAQDSEFNQTRSVFEPANIRALFLLIVFMFASTRLYASPVYKLLLGLYAVQFGTRVGFFDFSILSGRFASSFGFAEIFLLPIFVKLMVKTRWVRWSFGGAYLFVHAYFTLTMQAPYLIIDYFS